MNDYVYYKYIYSISQFNVLPVTSKCNYSCVFCSHRQNPPSIETFTIPDLTPSEAEHIIDFIDPLEKIVIGESATRIIEGEPFCNPYLIDLLNMLRNKFPETLIHIATNGSFLQKDMIKKLSHLLPLDIHISVNILTPYFRSSILGEKSYNNLEDSMNYLAYYNIPFSASVMALPYFTGWEAIIETIKILGTTKSEIIKLFWPSTTRYTSPELKKVEIHVDEMINFYKNIQSEIIIPVILEPPLLDNLRPFTEGAISNTPGEKRGIQKGDEIITINGYKPKTRVDAFKKINSLKNPVLKIKRNNEEIIKKIVKPENSKSGLTFAYDIDYDIISDIKKQIVNQESTVIITSELACNMLKYALKREGLNTRVIAVKNRFFGGNIGSAGLLTVEDILWAIALEKNIKEIILPSIAFDERGCDLTGTGYTKIQDKTGFSVTLI